MTDARSITFGRGPGVDVVVDDKYCSPVHCRVTLKDGRFYVEDCGSTNGTRILRGYPGAKMMLGVTEIKVEGPTWLMTGDRVRIGRTTLPWSAS